MKKYLVNNVYITAASVNDAVKKYKIRNSLKDSDKLKQMAYKFAQMGNYFDRANSARAREILAKEDDKKYPEFYNYAVQVYQQLKLEVENIKRNSTVKQNYSWSFDNQTLSLLNDGANRLYWIAEDRRDNKGELISKKILELAKEYKNATYDSIDDFAMRRAAEVIPEHQVYHPEYSPEEFKNKLEFFVKQTIGRDATSGMKQIEGLLETVLNDYKADINNKKLDINKTKAFYKQYKTIAYKLMSMKNISGPVRDLIETRIYNIRDSVKDASKQEVERAINNLGYKVKRWTKYAGDVSAIVDPTDVNKDGYAYFNKQVKKLKQYAEDVYADGNEIVFYEAKFSI